MSNNPNDYKKLVGDLFVIKQEYDFPWKEEHGKILKEGFDGETYEVNNIISKTYWNLAVINGMSQGNKNSRYYYDCTILQTNIDFNGEYPFEAYGAYPFKLDLNSFSDFRLVKNFKLLCRDVSSDIEWTRSIGNQYYYANSDQENDMYFLKRYEEVVLGCARNYIDYRAWMRYKVVKSRELENMIQPLAQYSNMKLAG